MAAPRKIFRIEETAAMRLEPPAGDAAAAPHGANFAQQLSALRAVLAATPAPQPDATSAAQRAEIERLASELHLIRAAIGGTQGGGAGDKGSRLRGGQLMRIGHELDAVMKGSEQATQGILAAAEDIDQAANNLAAALKGEIERGLAQDILDRVIQIFEACNFQDLICQRVAKVMTALDHIEDQITRALDVFTPAGPGPSLHGPRLESDHGHVSQSDVDAMFADGARRSAGS